MAAALMGLGSCSGPLPQTYEVDVLEDDGATVVPRPDGLAKVWHRTALPPEAKEGDVVVDGRVDPILTAQLRDEVREARARLRRIELSPGGTLDVEDGSDEGAASSAETR
ncbi:MAG: DUF3006 domain-containing protein [Myxococcaceae bacterium]|nr:DUF3006 domain-containing protein [Myxococcaceae bacterium]